MTVITMSRTEIDRMSVLRDLAASRIRVTEAATLMRLGRRQVFRLAKAYGKHGPQALVSRRRGRPSNRAYPADLRDMATGIIRERYPDFGPTLAAEKLAELHDIHLARRDGSAMDDHGGCMEGSPGPVEGGSSAAVPARLPGRAGPDRRVRALVVRGSGATMHPTRLHRRRHQPPDASAVCREREHVRLFCGDPSLSGALRQAGGALFRQARCVSGQQEGCDRR